jgi:hypothetical protein
MKKNAICREANCFLIIDRDDDVIIIIIISYYIVLAFLYKQSKTNFVGVIFGASEHRDKSRTAVGQDADIIPRRLETLPNLYTVPLEDGLKESPNM